MDNDKLGILKALVLLSQVGLAIAVPIIGGLWLGTKIDQALNTGGIFLGLGILAGIFTGFRSAYRLLMPSDKEK